MGQEVTTGGGALRTVTDEEQEFDGREATTPREAG